jgi:hypothetical protein
MVNKIKNEFGTIKRYCEIRGWNYSVFMTSKSLSFITPIGQRILETLKSDGLIDKETYLKFKINK